MPLNICASGKGAAHTLNARVINRATLSRAYRAQDGHVIGGDVLDAEGCVQTDLRRGGSFSYQDPVAETSEAHFCEGIYGGHYHHHFGHFLIETLTSIAAIRRLYGPVKAPIFLHDFNCRVLASKLMPPHAQMLIEGFGFARDQVHIVRSPVSVERLHVFDRPYQLARHHLHVDLGAEFRAARDRILGIKRFLPRRRLPPIYLSRSRLKRRPQGRPGANVLGEEMLEAALSARGFKIVHPEALSIAEQMALYARAPALVGLSGSALHQALWCEPGMPTVNIVTQRINSSAYRAVAEGVGGTYHEVPFEVALQKQSTGPSVLDVAAICQAIDAMQAKGLF